jgi:hypothetical protein
LRDKLDGNRIVSSFSFNPMAEKSFIFCSNNNRAIS